MTDTATTFSQGQAITVSVASNWPSCGFGTAGPGVLDTGGEGSLSEAVKKFPLKVTVGIPFAGPAAATLSVLLQESADNVNWANTDLGNLLPSNLAALQIAGGILLWGPIPIVGGSTNPSRRLLQFLRVYYLVAGGPFTAGTVNAILDTD